MVCIYDYDYDVLLSHVSNEECIKFIREITKEVYYVQSGYELMGLKLTGGDRIPVGVDGTCLVFQFVRPCWGASVVRLDDTENAIEKLRRNFLKDALKKDDNTLRNAFKGHKNVG